MILPWSNSLIMSGIPFKSKGRDRLGLDCWGVICLAYKELYKINLPTFTDEYKTVRHFQDIENVVTDTIPKWEKVTDEREGDVIVLKMRNRPLHVGLIVKRGLMLHIEQNVELCIESYKDWKWINRIEGIYRYKEII